MSSEPTEHSDKPTVLFVCVHNAGRSQMAASYLQSLGDGRIEVLSAGSEPADQLNPVAVQEYIAGEDVRVYVVDGEVVAAARIVTGELDYRRDPNFMDRIHAIELPPDVQQRTAAVFEGHRLVCGSMDLRLTEEGEFVFLEVNSGGSYLELQRALGVKISDLLADLLVARAGHVELPASEPATLPLGAVVATEAVSAEELFDVEPGLEALRIAVRGLVPERQSIEIELTEGQQQALQESHGIRARRARLDVTTHVMTPIQE